MSPNEFLAALNVAPGPTAREQLERCCGSRAWVEAMLTARPFADADALFDAAGQTWWTLQPQDWLEAFGHHPRIGDVGVIRKKFASTAEWASGEQSGVGAAPEEVLQALARGNAEYEARFGYIFIVCASGKTAPEMLALLQARLGNEPGMELPLAAAEQAKITRLRLEKLLAGQS